MTLGEGKEKVYMLLDEYSTGGVVEEDEDIEIKMTAFFDIAQKKMAGIKKILRLYTVEREPGKTLYEPPKNFSALRRVWENGENATRRYKWMAGKLIVPESVTGSVELEYYAMPETIPGDADDSYEFEIAEDAAQCMPFFVAAQQLSTDIVTDSGALLNLFQIMVSGLNTTVPGDNLPTVRQSFFRGWR